MFNKFLSLFRGQVAEAITDGADDGLNEAQIADRVKTAVEEGVEDALAGLHKLLAKPVKAVEKSNGKAESNGKVHTRRVVARASK